MTDVGNEHASLRANDHGALSRQPVAFQELGDVGSGTSAAVVPGDGEGVAVGIRSLWKEVTDLGVESPVVVVGLGALRTKGDGVGEAQRLEDGVVDVAAHVPEGARAVVQALAPLAGMVVALDVVGEGRRPDPGVPIQSLGHGILPIGLWVGVSPALVAEGVPLLHFADHPVVHELHRGTVLGRGMNLDSHLGVKFVFLCVFGQGAGLENIVRERLLAIDVQAHAHGRHRHRGVHVVGYGDVCGVEVLALLLQHFPPVCINLGIAKPLLNLSASARVDLHDRSDGDLRVGGNGAEVRARHAAAAEAGVSHGFARGLLCPRGLG